jgi:DNA-directed RNA polymerase subunit RPC12/RpoP
LNQIINVALQKDPNNRFEHCESFKSSILKKGTELNISDSIKSDKKSIVEDTKSKAPAANNIQDKLLARSKNILNLSIATIVLSLVPILNFIVLIFGPIVILSSSNIIKQKPDSNIISKASFARRNAWISISIFFSIYIILGFIIFNGLQNENDTERLNEFEIPNSIPESDETRNQEVNTDYDGDGVSNNYDKCPNESGSSNNSGCPYQIYCGSCGSQWNEQNISKYSKISCQNCGEELLLCKRNDGMYGITNGDVYDETCDCSDCWDESE